MTQFSANLGFLFTELSLTDAITASAKHGFDAVECHFPYAMPAAETKAALDKTGLKMLGLNTVKGNAAQGDNGLCALADRKEQAIASIDQALEYAAAIDTPNVHVMAGVASGDAAYQCYIDNLRYAAEKAAEFGINILIEPLNPYDAPGYFLHSTQQAEGIIDTIAADNLKLMFDCYHIQIIEGDVCRRLATLLPIVGHIQIASVPDRAEPDEGELNYRYVIDSIKSLGYKLPIGAEYKPSGATADTLQWMNRLR